MMNLLQSALVWADPVISFFFLIYTVSHTLPFRTPPNSRAMQASQQASHSTATGFPCLLSLAGGTVIFLLLYKPVQARNDHFMIYWTIMLVLGLAYTFLFTSTRHALQITTCITYLSWITLTKSTLGALLTIFDLQRWISFNSVPFYVLWILLLWATSFFMQRHSLEILQDFPLRYWICMIVTPAVISLAANIALTAHYGSSTSTVKTIQLSYVLLFFLSLMVYYLSYAITTTSNSLAETRLTNQILHLQVNHMERSSAMVEQIHRDKHEMKNVYFYIQSLIKSGQIAELEEFVDTKLVHRFDAWEEYHTGNQLVDYMLSQKASEAKENNITFMTNAFLPAHLSIADTDLCGLLLNLIDNAIDASRKEEKPDIRIMIRQIKGYLVIEVRNRCTTDVLKDNPSLSTTKKDRSSHGYGLKIINSIITKYEGIKDVHMESGYFVTNVMLRNDDIQVPDTVTAPPS